ncbi:hypothetical protein [Meiothermus taiwanensis]|uniref:Uncharacterized protein n=2 Tax=Meiothermus taiwanensis TaxID=172827 RepID=A0A399E623_9DEIN|nr:hypothetical protein [Meiothermus taiwanensis]AWR87163.1 hypothetical protein Mtai_v1c19290 [Meiothermus taiwanensis WR-220]RIH78190.1 hypothetical protein Mcate_00931 [Meiothermus taiwanensis]
MNRLLVGMGIFLSALVLAQSAQRTYRLFINGQAQATPAIVVNGKTYVPLEALQKAGAQASLQGGELRIQLIPVGGQEQAMLLEGKKGEWLSNGTWRLRVLEVTPGTNPFFGSGPGYVVRVEVRNLTRNKTSLHKTGFDGFQLLDNQGNKLVAADFGEKYTDIAQADGLVITLRFGPNPRLEAIGAADKLLVNFRPSGGRPALKGFRVFLAE